MQIATTSLLPFALRADLLSTIPRWLPSITLLNLFLFLDLVSRVNSYFYLGRVMTCRWTFLNPESPSNVSSLQRKSFTQVLNGSFDIPISELPLPCVNGDSVSIKISEDEYQSGLEGCKNRLHGRLLLLKDDIPIKIPDLHDKISKLWKPLGQWRMIPLGKGFYKFSFASQKDLCSVLAVGAWNLQPGLLHLFQWSPDFIPTKQKQTHAQCWVRIHDLLQEYWRSKLLFEIAGGLGTPISFDEATRTRAYGHYARVLVDVDLTGKLLKEVMVEREGFAFPVGIEYEKLPSFCSHCKSIGHLASTCKFDKEKLVHKDPPLVQKTRQAYVPEVPEQKSIDVNGQNDTSPGKNLSDSESVKTVYEEPLSPDHVSNSIPHNSSSVATNTVNGSTEKISTSAATNVDSTVNDTLALEHSIATDSKGTPTPVSVHSKATCDLTVSGKNLETPEINVQDLSAFPTVVQNDFNVLSAWLEKHKYASTSKEGEQNNVDDGFTVVTSKSQKKYNPRLNKKPNSRPRMDQHHRKQVEHVLLMIP